MTMGKLLKENAEQKCILESMAKSLEQQTQTIAQLIRIIVELKEQLGVVYTYRPKVQ